jgi:hypothetical protein
MTYPGTATKLAKWWYVHKDGLLIFDERIDNVRAILEHLVVHVALTTRETTPVCKDHNWKLLAVVEILQCLRGLEGRVRVPDTTSFL